MNDALKTAFAFGPVIGRALGLAPPPRPSAKK
ncbi:hypothetical protein EAH73_19555 [Hymenobacter nivis]|uniref:Uncharacterized protein n=1 Tax=Hymenobacter nivis TaxID=1850093 RepID=A0A502GLJ5_9BACT|nr:hypothetical protein EAH73_19555 [Hymenobacter nivis]